MAWWQGWLARARAFLWRRVAEQDLDAEIRHHLELETEANLRRGLSPLEARRRARLAFGGVEQVKEEHRDGRPGRWLDELRADVRSGLRGLYRSPAFAIAAILTLGVGVGANTAVFSVVNAVLLRPLPFADPGRLVMLSEDNPEKGWSRETAAPANYLDWRERVKAFADVAGYAPGGRVTLTGDGSPPRILRSAVVTGNFFSLLGIRPAFGRLFDSTETWKTGPRVAVLSHRVWREQFGGADVRGRSIRVDGRPVQIVGVASERFVFPGDPTDLWLPTAWNPADRTADWFRRGHWLRVVARLRAGETAATADAAFQVVIHQLQREYPATNRVMGGDLVPLHDFLMGDLRLPLLVLQSAVAVLLLLAAANVGNLLLVQAAGREREAALRLTLGAGRARLIRQAMTESLVLAVLGGAAGTAIGLLGTRLLVAQAPVGLLPPTEVALDGRLLGFAVAITLGAGLLFGIAPTVWNRWRTPAEIIKEGGGRGSEAKRSRRIAGRLAMVEVALALLLSAGAGLLVRSFNCLLQVDPGFDSSRTLTVAINLPEVTYDTDARVTAFFDRLLARASALPGTERVALGFAPPLTNGNWTSDFHLEGRPPNDYGSEVAHDVVSPGYFRLLGTPIKAGREFTAQDRAGSVPVAIINDQLARRYFGPQDPIGTRITFDKFPDSTSVWRTIVGVVGSVRQNSLALTPQIEVFVPFAQSPNSYATMFVRAKDDATRLLPTIRSIVSELDPNLTPSRAATMDEIKRTSLAKQRFFMTLLLAFAGTGLFLAIVGVYGVMAQLARRQVREMGIRMALGARTGTVQWLVIRQGLRLLVPGVIAGSAVALFVTRAMRGLLFEISPSDPSTLAATIALLALATCLASWIPARRASRADPAAVLRAE